MASAEQEEAAMRSTFRASVAVLATLAGALMLLTAGPAAAQVGYPPPPQPPTVFVQAPSVATPAVSTSTTSSSVAFTGADVLRWALMALVLVAIGAVLVTVARRRRHTIAS
jgi:hypothetical protein